VSRTKRDEILGILGVGLDGEDGETRVTRNENFLLVGGSQETHERMQDTSIRFNEALEARGKRLEETEVAEALDLLREAMDQ
jgi:hypothetical protein